MKQSSQRSSRLRSKPTTMKKTTKNLVKVTATAAAAAVTCCTMFLLPSPSDAFTISFAVPPTLVPTRTNEPIVKAQPTSPPTSIYSEWLPSVQNEVRSRKKQRTHQKHQQRHRRQNQDDIADTTTTLKVQPLHRLTTSNLAERQSVHMPTSSDYSATSNLFHDQAVMSNEERTRHLQKQTILSTFSSRRHVDRSVARLLLLNMIIFLLQEFHKLKQFHIAKEITQKAFLSTISSIDISGFPGMIGQQKESSDSTDQKDGGENDEYDPYRYLTNLKKDNHIVAMNDVLKAQDKMQPIWHAAGQAVLEYGLI